MRAHGMGFDEFYNEHYYRRDTVKGYAQNEAECLIVIGTTLTTGLVSSIVRDFISK